MAIPPEIAVIKFPAIPGTGACPVTKNQISNAKIRPTAKKIAQIAVACLKLSLKE